MSVYYNSKDVVSLGGWLKRQEKAKERLARHSDPLTHAIARGRAAMREVAEAENNVRREWAEANVPVALPLPPMVHRDVAALITKLLVEHGLAGRDLTMPLAEGPTLADLIAQRVAMAEAEKAAADAEVARLEGMRDAYAAIVAAGPYGVSEAQAAATLPDAEVKDEAEPARRGRGRPPRALAETLANEGFGSED